MTKNRCPLGEDCDLTIAWMAGAARAKDRIMELEAKLATCKKYRDAYAECDRIGTQAVRELEAKMAKAVTSLQYIATNKISDELSVVEWDTYDPFSILDGCILSARTTLAELTGGKDD